MQCACPAASPLGRYASPSLTSYPTIISAVWKRLRFPTWSECPCVPTTTSMSPGPRPLSLRVLRRKSRSHGPPVSTRTVLGPVMRVMVPSARNDPSVWGRQYPALRTDTEYGWPGKSDSERGTVVTPPQTTSRTHTLKRYADSGYRRGTTFYRGRYHSHQESVQWSPFESQYNGLPPGVSTMVSH
ncbi:hypothetical protein EYF80_044603 [Liparis tanakae]|uniref:Uncharacterized protein n=1 Tax=Liparis tanakae TaxID=230148 RepID=A0A4Z2FWM8_9TELE|nr:hypothetical protein EYF80_044603 [Liparis tanakae]